jgi:3-oxoacyl-[acyl-carrier protein] reductase
MMAACGFVSINLKRKNHHPDRLMVAFVAGPESSYITGASLTVDGGPNA